MLSKKSFALVNYEICNPLKCNPDEGICAAVGVREFKSELTVLHAEAFEVLWYFFRNETNRLIYEYERTKQTVLKKLRDHTRKILGGVSENLPIKFKVIERQPAEAIQAAMGKDPFDLIVIGTNGFSGLNGSFWDQ